MPSYTFPQREHRLSIALRCALSGAALLPFVAGAQVVPPGNKTPVSYTNTGTTPPDQQTVGQPGLSGGAGTDLVVELQTAQDVQESSASSLVDVSSTGGNGGAGGISNAGYGPSGPLGGNGGAGGALTVTLDAPTDAGAYSVLENGAANGSGISLSSQGGDAGAGQQNEGYGNGGVGGTGGAGGKVVLDAPINPNQPSELSYVQASGAAISLYSGGGRGGDSGESEGIGGNKITGRKGGSGGKAGEIDVSVAGNINGVSGGSGIQAVSVGGNGGAGGDATDYTAQATGSDGGDAGDGGAININVLGGTVTGAGPAKAGTGPQQTFDSASDPSQVVPLDTSVTAGAILAMSSGGIGGQAGEVNGSATKGGNGAQGGTGGDVMINLGGSSLGVLNNNAVLSTTGYNTFGAMALSQGGSGGGGDAGGGVYFRKGGNGGAGGNAGAANILAGNDTTTPYAKVITKGDDSDALVAMSVGGGGGYSGDLNDGSGGGAFSVYIGGEGGNGGNGTNAYIGNGYYDAPPTDGSQAAFHPGDVIITSGTYARGMVAQSVGGGGGRGGDVTNTALGSSVTIGGSGGNGGTGGTAGAVNFGLIDTSGQHSSGIFSQSVGGGGGSGGGALSRAVGAQVSVSIAVGGEGGKGGNATEADAYNLGQVQTTGGNAHGIFAQAVGGGGGLGGTAAAENYSTSLPGTPSITLTTSVGGRGGAAGDGGTINVVNAGLLQTQGQDAYGVFAQSVGGGGGAGGDATSTSMAYQQAKLTVNTAVGGAGGAGGDGGAVKVWNSGLVSTSADKAIGVFAQSVGGGGGVGGVGTTDQGGLYQAGNYSSQVSVAIGGQGGASGKGNDVLVNNYISGNTADPGYFSDKGVLSNQDVTGAGGILTQGDLAPGIFAQSVGGGGGNGGDATGKGSNGQVNVNVGIGGGGGAGGDGGNVTVHNGSGAIQTYGAQSYGIFGQSVGGGGGNGGNGATGSGDDPEYQYSKLAVDLAASSNTKNPGGFTQVTDQLWDWKDNVKGAWDDKSSLDDLYNTTHQLYTPSKPTYSGLTGTNLTVDVGGGAGGKGGSAGDGETVMIDSAGSITTHGPLAYGIFGQSVGGGGGVGGAAAPVTANDKLHDSLVESSIAVGGSGGKGGKGGSVTLTNNAGGDIETGGDLSFGMFAQSIGGGGGVGGASLPSAGIGNPMALSLGAASLDADDQVSGAGSSAAVSNSASITTSGDNAAGIVAQSIGGGGGLVAVMGQSQDADTGLFHTTTQTLAQGNVKPVLAANYDSTGNVGGNASASLNSGGTITTGGTNAFGILAQSIGGGGGLMVVDPNNQVTVNQLAANPDNYAPAGGNKAGLVNVTSQGQTRIATSGAGAAGIVAQSLGGSGVIVNGLNGVELNTTASEVYQNRWDMGMGGAVTVNNNSDIYTTGDYAHGIFAQVASGTGGVIGRSDGTGLVFRSGLGDTMYCNGKSVAAGGDCGGAVNVNLQAGTIDVTGHHSWGVAMESEYVSFMYDGDNKTTDESNTALTVANGALVKAEGNAEGAVLINGTGTNTVVNAGVIDGHNSAGGYAIQSVNKSFKVTNQSTGTIEGSISSRCSGDCKPTVAATAISTIDNQGLIATGDVLDLDGGLLQNTGVVTVHGTASGTTALNGSYKGNGALVFDADYAAGHSDHLAITGSADIAGTVTVRPATMRNQSVALLSADGGLSVDPTLNATRSELFTTRLDHDSNTLYATPEAHFSEQAAGAGAAEHAVADHLQSLFDHGVVMDRGFTALAAVDSDDAYHDALRSMSGRALGSIGAFRFQSSRDFVSNLDQGCDQTSDSQQDCSWARAQASSASQDESSKALGYRSNSQTLEAGLQRGLTDSLTLGAGVGYERSSFSDQAAAASVDGSGILAGVGLKYNNGPWDVSGILDAAKGRYDSTRRVAVGNEDDLAKARPGVWNAGLHLQAGYTHDFGGYYLKPFAELRGIEVHGEGYSEQGNSPFNLTVRSQSQRSWGAGLGAEVGKDVHMENGSNVRLYVNGAAEFSNGNDWRTRAQFSSDPAGETFDVMTRVPDAYARLGLGVNFSASRNIDFSLSYDPEFGSGYHANSGVARLDWRF